jgi:hypothetical protein
MAQLVGAAVSANEARKGLKIAICVPAMDMVHGWFAYSLALAMSAHTHKHPEDKLILYFAVGTLIEQSREQLSIKALDWGADYIVWFDSDMRFPKDVISELVKHDKDIVGCNYPTRKWPQIEPTAFWDDLHQTRVYTKEKSTGLEEVASLGFGCIAIKSGVFDTIQEPWFLVPWSREMMEHDCGEDIYFCRKARDAGIKVYIDHDLSKKVCHIGQREYTYKDVHGDHELQ